MSGKAVGGGVSGALVAGAIAGFSILALLARLRKERITKAGKKTHKIPSEVAELKDSLAITLNSSTYLDLLGKLIGEAEHVQNYPPELIPQEDKIIAHILQLLKPYEDSNGGPLKIEVVSYEPGRGNIIITYPGTDKEAPSIGLIGAHLDVVPADADSWERNPFELVVEGDNLYGRGTTDCLGHVALVTCFLQELARKKPKLKSSVVAVFIASEEANDKPDIGIDGLVKHGKLDMLKSGACLWIDASDSEPCLGTGGVISFHLKAYGKRFHSGFPHKTVNPIELASEAMKYVQDRFYQDFPGRPEEKEYNFETSSTMKPTQIKCASGGLNQIPSHATISGDIRLTPFYSFKEVVPKVRGYVNELNETMFSALPTRGPHSKYEVPELGLAGKVEIDIDDNDVCEGIACRVRSKSYQVLCHSITSVRGFVNPYSVTGALPLVRDIQDAGFDLQITGFGLSNSYHAENEYCKLSDMEKACKILSLFVSGMNEVLN